MGNLGLRQQLDASDRTQHHPTTKFTANSESAFILTSSFVHILATMIRLQHHLVIYLLTYLFLCTSVFSVLTNG